MIKTTVQVAGMACGMCESHVNEAIRNAFSVKKVTSSHAKNLTEIVSEEELDADTFPVKAQIEDFLSESRQHIVGADVPVGGKKTSYGKYGTGEHGLRDKDAAEEGHGQTDDICQHI